MANDVNLEAKKHATQAVDEKRRPPAAKEDAESRQPSSQRSSLTVPVQRDSVHLSIHRLHALDAHGRRYRAAARDEAEMRLKSHRELAQGQYLLNPKGSNV